MNQKRGQIRGRTMMLLLLITAAGCLFVFHNYILGNQVLVFSDGGSDTKEQYMMWYDGIVNMLRSGGITAWDFHNGMGASIYNLNLFNPFLWVIYLIGTAFGPEKIPYCMVYLLMAEILLAGQTCYLMLSERTYSERAKLLASFMYAFSGYLLVWGQHYSLGGILVLLPLLLVFIERSMYRRRALFGVAGMMGLIILNGYYQGYMVAFGVGIYVTIRTLLFDEGQMQEKLKRFGTIALTMAFGLLIGMVNLLPSLITVQTSERLDSDYSLIRRLMINTRLWDKEYLRTLLYRIFGTNLQGQGNFFLGYRNYYEAVQMFFSVLFIILLFQYAATIHRRNLSIKQKLSLYLGMVICVFAVVIKVGSMPFNAFAYPFTRHVFLMLPFFAMLSAQVLTQLFDDSGLYSRAALLAAGLVCGAVYIKAYMNYGEAMYETNALILGSCAVGSVVIIALMRRGKLEKNTAWLLLGGALFISTASDGGLTVRYRWAVSKLDTQYFQNTYEGDTIEALNWISEQDDGWYRVEKDYYTAAKFLEAMAQNYDGVSTYNSTQTGGSLQFVDDLWPQLLTGYDRSHDNFKNSVHEDAMASLVGVKYLLSLWDTPPADNYELLHQIGEVYIYRNTAVENPVQFFTKTLQGTDFDRNKQDLDIWNLLTEVMITETDTEGQLSNVQMREYEKTELFDIFDASEVDCEEVTEDADGPVMSFIGAGAVSLHVEELEEYERVWTEFTIDSDSSAPLMIYVGDDRGVDYLNKTSDDYVLEIPAGTEQIVVRPEDVQEPYTIRNLHFYGTRKKTVLASSSASDLAQITAVKDEASSSVSGTIEAAEDGYVMLAIPYQTGWSIEVDGEEAEIISGDYAFMAFKVSEGSHTFRAVYHIPLFTVSAVITVGSFLIWLAGLAACLVTEGLRGRKKHEKRV